MKKAITAIIFILLIFQVSAFCYTDGECGDEYTDIYPQNINDYDGGLTEVYLENPSSDTFQDQIISLSDDTNKVDTKSLFDTNNVIFLSEDDFYTTLQIANSNASLNLYTQKDLNAKTREMTTALTIENVNWTFMLLMMIIELFKIIVNILVLLLSMYVFFRIIPFSLKFIKNTIFKIMVKTR